MKQMNKLIEYIIQINTLNYSKQCEYIKNKLLSINIYDISYIMLFKKVDVIFKKLPDYLKDINIEINKKRSHFLDFLKGLDDRSYCEDDNGDSIKGFIKVNYVKLTDNIYQIDVLVKKASIPIISYINNLILQYPILIFFIKLNSFKVYR